MAEISYTKTPQAGEYWISDDGSIIRIVGVKLNGGVIYENQAGFSFQFNSMTNWRHEPRCTGFDWVEPQAETWPKYYVGKNWSDADAYVRFDNATDQCVWVSAYGSEETHDERYAYVPDAIRRHSWREITEAEALARVEPHPLMDCLECGEFRGHGHVCQPAVKRVPVRLFTDDRNNMFAVCGEWPIVVGTQIKHDANGFYVEGVQP